MGPPTKRVAWCYRSHLTRHFAFILPPLQNVQLAFDIQYPRFSSYIYFTSQHMLRQCSCLPPSAKIISTKRIEFETMSNLLYRILRRRLSPYQLAHAASIRMQLLNFLIFYFSHASPDGGMVVWSRVYLFGLGRLPSRL